MSAIGEVSHSRRWPRVVLWGVAYFVIGIGTAALARGAEAGQMQKVWRLAAWLLSAVAFAAHIWYERYRAGGPPVKTALPNALAVALGGFLLAAAATVHSLSAGVGRLGAYAVALVAWPVLVGVPAFLVALAAAALLGRASRARAQSQSPPRLGG